MPEGFLKQNPKVMKVTTANASHARLYTKHSIGKVVNGR